uniref:Uncharacterized protein n=1 Tax=Arundo donax TaxID=35708 RepID=A0A0A9EW62_ARUDO
MAPLAQPRLAAASQHHHGTAGARPSKTPLTTPPRCRQCTAAQACRRRRTAVPNCTTDSTATNLRLPTAGEDAAPPGRARVAADRRRPAERHRRRRTPTSGCSPAARCLLQTRRPSQSLALQPPSHQARPRQAAATGLSLAVTMSPLRRRMPGAQATVLPPQPPPSQDLDMGTVDLAAAVPDPPPPGRGNSPPTSMPPDRMLLLGHHRLLTAAVHGLHLHSRYGSRPAVSPCAVCSEELPSSPLALSALSKKKTPPSPSSRAAQASDGAALATVRGGGRGEEVVAAVALGAARVTLGRRGGSGEAEA